jgi:hypothetical protein
MSVEHFFDLARIDIEAAADDHIFHAVFDKEEPVIVAVRTAC